MAHTGPLCNGCDQPITANHLEDAELALVVLPGTEIHWAGEQSNGEVIASLRRIARCLADLAGVRMCRVCGCTDLSPCEPPCSWIAPELCSSHGGIGL